MLFRRRQTLDANHAFRRISARSSRPIRQADLIFSRSNQRISKDIHDISSLTAVALAVIGIGLSLLFPEAGLAAPPPLKKQVRYRLYFPEMNLDKENGERISAIKIVVSCGRFRGLTSIPNDWSVEVVSPSSEITTLKATAGHGSTALWGIKELNGVVLVAATEPSCFEVSSVVDLATSDATRRLRFGRNELKLRK